MKKKLLVPVICILMMIIGGFATWAYLTSQDSAVNTFTVGDVAITLDELDTDNSTPGENDRDQSNKYHLIPGQTYVKDPTIHVAGDDTTTDANEGSENCYLYVTVKNDIATLEPEGAESIASQMAAKHWELLKNEDNETVTKNDLDVYYYKYVATAGQDVLVFESFKIDGAVNNTKLAETAGQTDDVIAVTAYAIQVAGFNSNVEGDDGLIPADANEAFNAWKAANGQFE